MLLAATVGSAAAKCEVPDPPAFCQEVLAHIDFAGTGVTMRAGVDTPVRIWISRGEQPIEPTSVTLVFARVADSAVIRAEATESAEAGLWLAQVTLPAGGSWTLVAEIDGIDGAMQRLPIETLQVRQPLLAPDQPGTPGTPLNPTVPALPIAILVAGLAAAALLAPALRERTQRRVAA